MLLPSDPQLPLSSRSRRLAQRVAATVAVGCLLGLIVIRVGAVVSF